MAYLIEFKHGWRLFTNIDLPQATWEIPGENKTTIDSSVK